MTIVYDFGYLHHGPTTHGLCTRAFLWSDDRHRHLVVNIMEKICKLGYKITTDLLKPELSFLNNMDLAHKNVWAPFSHYTLQLHMDFPGLSD